MPYVDYVAFKESMVNVLYPSQVYCLGSSCYWSDTCDNIKSKWASQLSGNFSVALYDNLQGKSIDLEIPLIEILIEGSKVGDSDSKCFLSFFPVSDTAVNDDTWVL